MKGKTMTRIQRYWTFTGIQLIILITAIFVLLHTAKAHAQPGTNITTLTTNSAPTFSDSLSNLLASAGHGLTNCDIIPYGIYAKGLPKHYGGGVAVAYPFSQYVVVATRLDYVNGDFWMPSGNATLQLPLHPFTWLTLTPFTYAGIGVPVSGGSVAGISFSTTAPKNNNGQATAILGAGASLDLYHGTGSITKVSLICDVEQWSGFPGKQYRGGLVFKFGKW